MSLLELLLIAAGLSMDAMAVAICKGLVLKGSKFKNAVVLGLFFGGFQGLMPLIGYLLGTRFSDMIDGVDHFIAFFFLAFIGGKMVAGAVRKDKGTCETKGKAGFFDLILLSVATSIDALAVGVSFAFLKVAILRASLLIGAVTFILSFSGVFLGRFCGTSLGAKAELAGGVVLILIGLKILVEGL